jgi:ligand-binding SRPBCC domain-containing protein
MKTHQLLHSVWIPLKLEEAWAFFSNPDNLAKLTPEEYRMSIDFDRNKPISEGTVIKIKVKPLPIFSTGWKSIIQDLNPPNQFSDIQESGPFKLWNHTHSFKAEEEGTRVIDDVEYALPFGILGQLAHKAFVKNQINSLFQYREAQLKKMFG